MTWTCTLWPGYADAKVPPPSRPARRGASLGRSQIMPFDPEPTPLCGRLLIAETLIAQWLLGPWGKAPPKRGQEVGYVGDTMKRPAEEVEGKLHPKRAKVGTSTRPAVKPGSFRARNPRAKGDRQGDDRAANGICARRAGSAGR